MVQKSPPKIDGSVFFSTNYFHHNIKGFNLFMICSPIIVWIRFSNKLMNWKYLPVDWIYWGNLIICIAFYRSRYFNGLEMCETHAGYIKTVHWSDEIIDQNNWTSFYRQFFSYFLQCFWRLKYFLIYLQTDFKSIVCFILCAK